MKEYRKNYIELVKEFIEVKFQQDIIYNLSKYDIQDMLIELTEEIRDNDIQPEPVRDEERKQLIDANVKIMDKYKATFEDIQIMIEYLNGDMDKKKMFYNLFKKYDGKKLFMEDYYD